MEAKGGTNERSSGSFVHLSAHHVNTPQLTVQNEGLKVICAKYNRSSTCELNAGGREKSPQVEMRDHSSVFPVFCVFCVRP